MKNHETVFLNAGIKGPSGFVQIIPFGGRDTERGPFVLDEEGAAAIIADFDARKNDMVIDYEHQTLSGGEAPAAGWIKRLVFNAPQPPLSNPPLSPLNLRVDERGVKVRGGEGGVMSPGIWAVVEWTPRAIEYLKNREYRYLSPVFLKRSSDNRVLRLVNAALTNQPAIDGMVPVVNKIASAEPRNDVIASDRRERGNLADNKTVIPASAGSRKNKKEVRMKRLMELLGLAEEATEEEAIAALTAMKAEAEGFKELEEAVRCCLELAGGASISDVTGTIMAMRQAHELAPGLANEAAALKSRLARRDAEELVEAAMKQGKVAPAQKDWAQRYAETDPEGFKVFAAKSPVVVSMGEMTPPFRGDRGGLDETQRQVNKVLGIDEDAFAKFNG